MDLDKRSLLFIHTNWPHGQLSLNRWAWKLVYLTIFFALLGYACVCALGDIVIYFFFETSPDDNNGKWHRFVVVVRAIKWGTAARLTWDVSESEKNANAVINAVKEKYKLVSVYRKKKIGIGTPQIISTHKNEITGVHKQWWTIIATTSNSFGSHKHAHTSFHSVSFHFFSANRNNSHIFSLAPSFNLVALWASMFVFLSATHSFIHSKHSMA